MSDDNSESELYDNFRLTIQEKPKDKNVSGMILNLFTSLFTSELSFVSNIDQNEFYRSPSNMLSDFPLYFVPLLS